jgi:predicted phosphodiesterase
VFLVLKGLLVLWGAVLAGIAEAIAAPVLVRGPYLQRPDDRTIEVIWKTDVPSTGAVTYGAVGLAIWDTAESAQSVLHRVALIDLQAGRRYEYRVLGNGVALSPPLTFRAPRSADDDEMSFAVIGDTSGGSIPAEIAGRIAADAPDLVLHVGDVVYPDGRAQNYDPELLGPMAPLLATAPVMPILGDHDIRSADGAPFFSVFDLPANGITTSPRYYSFRQGDAEFFCLDVESSEYGEDSDQYRWLERGLAGSVARWKFVTVFEPPFSSENSNIVERLTLSPLFERYGVDIVFSGHEHLYERSKPIRMFGDSGTPVTYVVEGGGGASLSPYDAEDFSAFVSAVHGYVIVRIGDDTLRLEARDHGGTLIDSMTIRKASTCCPDDPLPIPVPAAASARVAATRR